MLIRRIGGRDTKAKSNSGNNRIAKAVNGMLRYKARRNLRLLPAPTNQPIRGKGERMKIAKGWCCYVCGKPVMRKVNDINFIVSMAKRTDRVFLICSTECLRELDTVFYRQVCENGTGI